MQTNIIINRTKISWKQKWEEKQPYGQFKRQTSEITPEKPWTWQKKENLKAETEYILIEV